MKFKVGDKVLCIDSDSSYGRLIVGNEYTVTKVFEEDYQIGTLENLGTWNEERFILVKSAKKEEEDFSDMNDFSAPEDFK
jgi:hypothetical protein